MFEIASVLRKTISNWMSKIIDGGCWPLLIDFATLAAIVADNCF